MTPSRTIRVLIADDSFFMRKLLRRIFDSDSAIEVVGEARDGVETIGEAVRLKPDVITMDYHMPKLNGAAAAQEILKLVGPVQIIMISAYTREGAEETLESLRSGAVDFVMKPGGELSLNIESISDVILTKVKVAAHAKVITHKRLKTGAVKARPQEARAPSAVIIGASTGGPPVLENIITELPGGFNLAICIAQHMPKRFTEAFALRLDKAARLTVKEAEEGDRIRAGMVFLAPGGADMELERGEKNQDQEVYARITKAPREPGTIKPSINVLMISAARAYRGRVVGVLLTGMGNDGVEGLKAIKMVHGHTIVQKPDTATVDAMPHAAIVAGIADEVLPPEKISQRIVELSKTFKAAPRAQ